MSKLSFAQEQQPLSVGWELWYPYQYHNNKQQLVGLDIESFNLIAKHAGYDFTYTELPWKRHLLMIRNGDMDIALGASKTAEREGFAFYSVPYRKESVKLFVRKGQSQQIKLTNLYDLIDSAYTIGVEGGYYYGKNYETLIVQPEFREHISEVIDLEQNVSMALKGYLNGFLVDPITMKAFVNKYGLHDEFEPHPVQIYEDDIYLMLSKKTLSEQDLNRFNQAITALKNNGTLEKLVSDWSSNH